MVEMPLEGEIGEGSLAGKGGTGGMGKTAKKIVISHLILF